MNFYHHRAPGEQHFVTEVSETSPMADLPFPNQSISEILKLIESCGTTSQTPASARSSRTHIMVKFENLAAGVVYGCMWARGVWPPRQRRREQSTQHRHPARERLVLLDADGYRSGREERVRRVSVVKHALGLNAAVGRFVKDVLGEREIRVLACMWREDGAGREGSVCCASSRIAEVSLYQFKNVMLKMKWMS